MLSNRLRILSSASYTIVVLLCILLLGITINAFYPYKVIAIKLPYPVKTPIVEAGKHLILESDYCKYRNTPAYFSTSFISSDNAITFTQETFVSNVKKGCEDIDLDILVPESLEPGMYHVELNVRYPINPLREVNHTFPSDEFVVVGSESASDSANLRSILMILDSWELIE